MADVVDIADHLPKPDPELIESIRILLREAQAGRLTGIGLVYLTHEDEFVPLLHFEQNTDAIAAASVFEDAAKATLFS